MLPASALETDLTTHLRALATRGNWTWAGFLVAWRVHDLSSLHAVLAGGLHMANTSPTPVVASPTVAVDDDASLRVCLQQCFGLLLSWPSRCVSFAEKVTAIHFLAVLWATQSLLRPEPVRVGPLEWRALAHVSARAAALPGACVRGVLQRLCAADALSFAAYSGPRGLESVARAARVYGLGDALVIARGPAAPLVDYVNEAIHHLRLKELVRPPAGETINASGSAGMGLPVRMAKAQSARLANAKANNNPPRDTGPQARARQLGAMVLLATGRTRGLHAVAGELCRLEAEAGINGGGTAVAVAARSAAAGPEPGEMTPAAAAFTRVAAAAGASPLPLPPLLSSAGGLHHLVVPARLAHCVADQPTPLSTVEGMLRPGQRAAKAAVRASHAAAAAAAPADDLAAGDEDTKTLMVLGLTHSEAVFMNTCVESAGPRVDVAVDVRAPSASTTPASSHKRLGRRPGDLGGGSSSLLRGAASAGPWGAGMPPGTHDAASSAPPAVARCVSATVLPRLGMPALSEIRAALIPDLDSAIIGGSGGKGSGVGSSSSGVSAGHTTSGAGGALRTDRRASPAAAATAAVVPPPTVAVASMPAWQALERARTEAPVAGNQLITSDSAPSLLLPDLPGVEVVELAADVAVAPATITSAVRALQALLLTPATPASAVHALSQAAGDSDALSAVCWCGAPHARTRAPFPDPIDDRILSHVERRTGVSWARV